MLQMATANAQLNNAFANVLKTESEMATIRQISEACGVSKPFMTKIIRELDPDGEHQQRVANRIEVDAWLASAASSEAYKRKGERGGRDAAVRETVEAIEEARDAFEHHDVEVAALRQRIADMESHHELMLAEKEVRIADLKDQIERLSAELSAERVAHEATRRELAMARELQGFKWPWQRREIVARYALPPATE